jgi:hypothetical protein
MSRFSDELWKGLGDAVSDIRHKAVEEPWFGREVTGNREQQAEPEPDSERLWGSSTRHIEPEPATHEREQEHDIDIDR